MKKRISFDAVMFAFSFWLIFITIEGSFSVQIVFPILILMILYNLFIKKKLVIKMNKEKKYLFYFLIALYISMFINLVLNIKYFSTDTVIGVIYFTVIVFWYIFNTNKVYTDKEIEFIKTSYILMSVICSLFLIKRFLDGQTGKIAMINLVGMEIDENYISALIAMATLYIFDNLLSLSRKAIFKIINIIFLIINILAVALSGSRASLLGMVLVMMLQYLIMFFEKITFKRILKFTLIMIIVIGAGIKILDYIPEWTYNRYFKSNYVDRSNENRMLMWKNGVNGIINNPIQGYSIRIFDKIPEYGIIDDFEIPDRVPAHQTYLDILIYSGIIGFIPFILFLYYLFRNFFNKGKSKYIPMIILFIFITNIIGAERSVFFWNTLIMLTIIKDNIDSKEKDREKNKLNNSSNNNEIVVKDDEEKRIFN